jgi:large subunit ribosomal protein L27
MAHVKSGGGAKRTVDVAGKRLGVKKFGGEVVKPGDIILRQRGTKMHPGLNVGMGKDHTIFSKIDGIVAFRNMTGYRRGKKIIDVVEVQSTPVKKAVKTTSKVKASATTKTTKISKSK